MLRSLELDTGISSTFVPFESQEEKKLSSYPAFFLPFSMIKKDNINVESKYLIIYDKFFGKNSYTISHNLSRFLSLSLKNILASNEGYVRALLCRLYICIYIYNNILVFSNVLYIYIYIKFFFLYFSFNVIKFFAYNSICLSLNNNIEF